ncbi:hypothetical protein FisN_1Hu322 [Fistulifera solaris]|uniref:Uncharacterized protein n=1 Tax=Fistulifera solaris TaxID=1519565 RepID=A0A1Z5J9V5_FISSO|nr:hypothetical protein FisN_1Hu322 [Fistulifera solaris]|eukprot:GAX10784.1 hypothetical protein FisN_1Hu322 [Fistulifera solaris]
MCKATNIERNSPVRLRPRELSQLHKVSVPPNKSNHLEIPVEETKVTLEVHRPYRKRERKDFEPCTPIQNKKRVLICPPAPRPTREFCHDLPSPIPTNLLLPLLEL